MFPLKDKANINMFVNLTIIAILILFSLLNVRNVLRR